MTAYADIANRDEDSRIDIIGRTAMTGKIVAFVTDDEPGKVERYIEKLKNKFPDVKVIEQVKGLIAGTVSVRIGIPKG